jgi:hypothetical protein
MGSEKTQHDPMPKRCAMTTPETVEVTLKNGDKETFSNVPYAYVYIRNDGVLEIESSPGNVIAKFNGDDVADWHFVD